MNRERPDLDGLRLIRPGEPDVFLMIGGRRRRVASPQVYDALWSEVDGLVSAFDVEAIALGPELGEGTCLVRADGDVAIHLLTAPAPGEIVRCFIPTLESLQDYGFDQTLVRNVPPLLIQAVPAGPDLVSAPDRLKIPPEERP